MIYKDDYINKLYTDLLKIYLIDGYNFYYQEMGGCQSSELAKTILKKDNEVICLSIESEMIDVGFKKIVYVKKYDYEELKKRSLWLSEGEVILENNFYEIDRKGIYTNSLEEINEIKEKRNKRYEQKQICRNNKIYNFDKEKICKILNKIKGFKSVRKNQIDYIYIYKYRNLKEYIVHLKYGRYKIIKRNYIKK